MKEVLITSSVRVIGIDEIRNRAIPININASPVDFRILKEYLDLLNLGTFHKHICNKLGYGYARSLSVDRILRLLLN